MIRNLIYLILYDQESNIYLVLYDQESNIYLVLYDQESNIYLVLYDQESNIQPSRSGLVSLSWPCSPSLVPSPTIIRIAVSLDCGLETRLFPAHTKVHTCRQKIKQISENRTSTTAHFLQTQSLPLFIKLAYLRLYSRRIFRKLIVSG